MEIRDAVPADAASIMEIYNDAVINTTAIWNDITVDTPNRVNWMADRNKLGYPVLVVVDGQNKVLGYASFGDWRPHDGYKYTVEHSVYLHKDARGLGLGLQMMKALIVRAQAIGKHVMVAAIEAGNQPSIELHKKLGFVEVGLMPEVGTKFGRWLDLAFLQLKLSEGPPAA